jgi:ribonuclease BN (tRNA processing enzyme)
MMTQNTFTDIVPSACCTADIVGRLLTQDRRVLLFGPPGIGKSTLAANIGRILDTSERRCWCISADPGSPGFGVPGAVSLGQWEDAAWRVVTSEALCTLDAGRFRLPLVCAVRRLSQKAQDGVLLIDGPGVVRGVAGRELLLGLAEAGAADVVLAITAPQRPPPLMAELCALALETIVAQASEQAGRPGKRARARTRTAQWNAYLEGAVEQTINLDQVNQIGTPPPLEAAIAWVGRQCALLRHNETQAMGEVLSLQGTRLSIRTPAEITNPDALLLRDALRTTDGLIETATPFASERCEYLPPPDIAPYAGDTGGPSVIARVGAIDVALVNGVYGDPLLHLRLRHQRRSLLFDLGDGARLPARIAHQITDVFITHAHMDHIGGFLWLLRSKIDHRGTCRLYGPPGLVQHIMGFVQGFLWDRIGERGPAFEVAELHGRHLRRFRLKAGHPGHEEMEEQAVTDGILLEDSGFRIRAVELDHHTPVVAYAYEPDNEIKIRKDRLITRGLEPGPWLSELKQQLLQENEAAMIRLPDRSEASVGALGADLVLISAGKRLVYATDLADTVENRARLIAFAWNAHTLFCEATFLEEDAEYAARHGHLTTRACGEIAMQAGVARLIPFHFSRRYEDNPQQIYEELTTACSCVVTPKSMTTIDQIVF